MNHPLIAIVSRREFDRLSRQVQYGEISWPQCFEYGKPIQLGRNHAMTTPRTIDELYRKLGLTHKTTHLETVTTARLRELVRRAWNFAVAAERKRVRTDNETRKENQ